MMTLDSFGEGRGFIYEYLKWKSMAEIAPAAALSIHIFISDSSYLLGCQAHHNE
jgi:hypothetical protein